MTGKQPDWSEEAEYAKSLVRFRDAMIEMVEARNLIAGFMGDEPMSAFVASISGDLLLDYMGKSSERRLG